MAVRVKLDAGELPTKGKRPEVGQLLDPLRHPIRPLGVEPDDHVGEVCGGGSTTEPAAETVARYQRRGQHRRGQADA